MAHKYFYDNGEEKIGPVSGADLVRLRAGGDIGDDTWVRRADSSTWRPLASVNLREEEEELRNPGLLTLLRRSGLLGPLLLFILGLGVFIVVAVGLLQIMWPVLLVLFILWIFSRALR